MLFLSLLVNNTQWAKSLHNKSSIKLNATSRLTKKLQ